MFGWPDPNTGFDQSEHALYTCYFISVILGILNISNILASYQAETSIHYWNDIIKLAEQTKNATSFPFPSKNGVNRTV